MEGGGGVVGHSFPLKVILSDIIPDVFSILWSNVLTLEAAVNITIFINQWLTEDNCQVMQDCTRAWNTFDINIV